MASRGKPAASPRRALPANTIRFVCGSVRNICAVKNDFTNPTSDPIPRAAIWPFAPKYPPAVGSTASLLVSRMIDPENEDSRNWLKTRSMSG